MLYRILLFCFLWVFFSLFPGKIHNAYIPYVPTYYVEVGCVRRWATTIDADVTDRASPAAQRTDFVYILVLVLVLVHVVLLLKSSIATSNRTPRSNPSQPTLHSALPHSVTPPPPPPPPNTSFPPAAMGRELQKRKNRSGVQKVRQKPKSKKRQLANPIIAANWDKSLTLAQNYKRLGLAAKLNKFTGGTEKKVSDLRQSEESQRLDDVDPLNITTSSKRKKQQLDLTEAKIERDPETGAILRVIEQQVAPANPLNDPLAEFDSDEEGEAVSIRNQHANTGRTAESTPAKTDTVRALEAQAARPAAKYKRRQPDGEVQFIEELVQKYGDDIENMARDTKINYMQRSEGDLKKRIKKWKEAGGRVD